MNDRMSELLRPSLTGSDPVQARLFSLQSHILVAFFIGPLGFAIFCLFEANNTKLLKKHWGLYSLITVISTVFIVMVAWATLNHMWPAFLELDNKHSILRLYGAKILALLSCTLYYFCLKPYFVASAMQGPAPRPWREAIYSLILAYAASFFLTAGMKYI